jgi:transposase
MIARVSFHDREYGLTSRQTVSKLTGLVYYSTSNGGKKLPCCLGACTAMGHIQGANRHEVLLFPERLDDYRAEDTPVRFLAAFVDELDLGACGFRRAVPAATGRPGSAPGDLLKRYRYGYLCRLRSSRRLEQETQRNVELLWLLKPLRPDHKTMANFRKHTLEPLRQVCRTLTRLCKKLDLFGAELSAIDGRKFRAVNSKERSFTQGKLKKLIVQIDERVAAYLKALEHSDDQEERGTGGGARAEALAAKIEALKQRKLLYEGFQAQLLCCGQAQLSLTDPESRAMRRGKGRGTGIGYNVQTAVDAKHKLIVACEVTNDPGDRDWLSPMALQAKEVLACRFDAVADVGYYHGYEVRACLEAGITPSVSRPITSAHGKLGRFSEDDFTYDRATDTYRCPAGALLTFRFDTVELGRHLRYDATSACTGGARKPRCTRNNGGRRMTRWVDAQRLEEMAPRVRSRPEVMKRRQELGEHPVGTMKRGWDHGDLRMRGLEQVRTGFRVTVLADTLRRVLNLVEIASADSRSRLRRARSRCGRVGPVS